MIKTFTQDDIVRFVYAETSAVESALITTAMAGDSNLRVFYNEIVEVKQGIQQLKYEPSEKTLQNIFDYSRSKSMPLAI